MEYNTLVNSSVNILIETIRNEITIYDLAVSYILIYVAYKGLSRYIYFKADEHASKINRTFLSLSLLIVFISHGLQLAEFIYGEDQFQWFLALCLFGLMIAPISIITGRLVYVFDKEGRFSTGTNREAIPIEKDYTRTSAYKRSQDGETYEDEVVKSTFKNIHSDLALNFLAGIFVLQYFSILFKNVYIESGIMPASTVALLGLFILAVYTDRAIFSWVKVTNSKKKTYQFEKKYKKKLVVANWAVFIFFVLLNLYLGFGNHP